MTTAETSHVLEPLMKVADVQDTLNVSRATVYRLVATGELQPVRVGARSMRFAPEALRSFVSRCGAVAP